MIISSATSAVLQPARSLQVVFFGSVTLDYTNVNDAPAITVGVPPDSFVGFYSSDDSSYPGQARIVKGGSMSVPCGGTFYVTGVQASVIIDVSIEESMAQDGGAICAQDITLGKNDQHIVIRIDCY